MRREDFFTGEPLQSGSPPFSSEFTSESEAIANASFGKYDYDPGSRIMSQPVILNPGGYGYNNGNIYNPYFMNPPVTGGNPAFAFMQQQQMQQQIPQEVQYFIKPVNFGGEYLPNLGYEEEIEQLKMEYWKKEQELAAKTSVDSRNTSFYNPYYGTNNYYGVPYYNPYQYNSLNSEIDQKISELKNQAKENRLSLNLHLSKLAHNYIGDRYDEAELKERYNGRVVQNTLFPVTYNEIYTQNRLANMEPFDNSQMYRDHHAAVSKQFNAVIPKDSNLKECFDNMGVLNAQYEMEEEQHRRRNGGTLYNSEDNSYKFFVRAKAAERYAKNNGLPLVKAVVNNESPQTLLNEFPTLSQTAKLCDDGTLNITCPFGSKAGQVYSVHNSQEAGYEQNRERFQNFLDSIPNSIYLDGPNGST